MTTLIAAGAPGETELRTHEANQRPGPHPQQSYVHQMRGPRYRWWRPLVALSVACLVFVVLALVVFGGTILLGGIQSESDIEDLLNPWASMSMNLTLACFIPATLAGLWVGFRQHPGRVLSVTGRMRWGWLGRCLAVLFPLWAGYLAITWFVFGEEVMDRPERWVTLLVVSLFTTPLQAAGEEIAFRGGLVQGLGAWFRSPVVALVVTTVVSTGLFAAAHGSPDLWILVELGSLAAAGCWLAWRTGGLEAVIALHVVNNLLVFATGILFGGLTESYVDASSAGSAVSAGMSVLATALVTAVLLRLARRCGIAPDGWRTPAVG